MDSFFVNVGSSVRFSLKFTRPALPEWAPADVALTKIFVVGGLTNQEVDLVLDAQAIFRIEVASGQLISHALDDVQSLLVQPFRLLDPDGSQAAHGRSRLQVGHVAACHRRFARVHQTVLLGGQDPVERIGGFDGSAGGQGREALLVLGDSAGRRVRRFRLLALRPGLDEAPVEQLKLWT